ncbi:MAG: ABC transporter permease [Thermofilaceae archaeon]|nr:ABC transporter permease [Thermofilaceae archaeon]MDW8003378.1 ABC transporter permease [Thermofilaceae archaeon]
MGALVALMIKDIKQLLRDPRSLLMVLLMPPAVMAMFVSGYGEERSEVPIIVVNLDEGAISWQLIELLRSSGSFKIVAYAPTMEAGIDLVRRGEAYAALIIPEGFSESVMKGYSTKIVTVLDAAYAMISELVWQAAVIMVQVFMKTASEMYGTFYIEVVRQTVYGPEVRSVDSFTSTILGVLLHLVPMSLIAVSISRERERKTFEQLIMAPVSGWQIVMGKFIAYALVTITDMVAVFGFAVYVLGVRVSGPPTVLILVSILLLLCSLSLGLLISAISRNQLQAYQAAIFFFIPSMLFSGFFMPVELLSPSTRAFGRVLPLYHFLRAFRNVQLRGWGFRDIVPECLSLLFETLIFLAAAIRLLKLRVD